jgi:predicted nucleic acid-binding protein
MNGTNFVFIDTNILIYILQGNPAFKSILEQNILISFITELEIFRFQKLSESEKKTIRQELSAFTIIDINQQIKNTIIDTPALHKLKLPDDIIAASCIYLKATLYAADIRLSKIQLLDIVLIEP